MPQSIACRFCHQPCDATFNGSPYVCRRHDGKTIYNYEANNHPYEVIIAFGDDNDPETGYSMGWKDDQLSIWTWGDGLIVEELPTITMPIPSSLEEADKLLQRIMSNMAFL